MKRIVHFILIMMLSPLYSEAHGNNVPPTQMGIEFIPNAGQWDGGFLYRSSNRNSTLFLEENGITYLLGAAKNRDDLDEIRHGKINGPINLRFHAYRVKILGAQKAEIVNGTASTHYYNYFLGNDPQRWKTDLHAYAQVTYRNILNNIDFHVGSDKGQMKYDFIVKKGANPSSIVLQFDGLDKMGLKDGKLQLLTSVGMVEELSPFAFQYINNSIVKVPCNYVLSGNQVSYKFPRGYNKDYELVIDPTVVFATFSGSTADNWGTSATYDAQGNFYAGGTVAGQGYPTTVGAYNVTYNGGGSGGGNVGHPSDYGITKFNASGTSLIYSTYIGGSDNEQPHSMIVDAQNNLIIAGKSYSGNFPITTGAFDASPNGGADLVVTKLNAAGNLLLGSTYVGGTGDDAVNISASWNVLNNSLKKHYGDDARSEVNVDNAGNIYVALPTQSTDFPVTSSAYQSSLQGMQDAAVIKLNPSLSALIYSTYLGGSSNDAAYNIQLDASQSNFYVGGGTESTNFPMPSGGLWGSNQGGTDGYILKFQNSGNYNIIAGTFIGTAGYDQSYGIQLDASGNVYSMGSTLGGTFPVSPGVFNNPNSSQYIIKLNNALSTRVYSTVYGSGINNATNISPIAFLVDSCENVYISGWGGPLSYPGAGTLNGMPVTPDAIQLTTSGAGFYFIVLSKDAQTILYGSFLATPGSVSEEHVDGGTSRFSKDGVIYQGMCGGCGGSSAFPTTPGSWSTTNNSNNCNFLAVKIAFNLGAVDATAGASPSVKGCPPLTVNFTNSSSNATSFVWNFGDGSATSSAPTPTHVYTTPGTYTVKLLALNPNACIKRDSVFLTIIVDSNKIIPSFNVTKTDSCGPFIVNIQNTSTLSNTPGAINFTRYVWDFGDGTTFTGANPGTHTYPANGNYTIKLKMYDSTACVSPDSVMVNVDFNASLVKAGINIPDSVCYDGNLVFANNSTNATSFLWQFGDGTTSTSTSPTHIYPGPGKYKVKLVAYNPNSCNKVDSVEKEIELFGYPKADFTFTPNPGVPNEPIYFSNLSTGGVSYHWNFGDGNGSTDKDPTHLYTKKGENTVCLTVINIFGCADTVCKKVYSDIKKALDVPTAFTPNGDGNNDILYVRGGAVKSMHFQIFNRWGEMIFESYALDKGWDGTYKGVLQEMEAYAWTLEATFVDESRETLKGNVTLIR